MQSIPANFVHFVVNYKDTTDNVHITVQKHVLDAMKQSGIICFVDFVIIMQCCSLFVVIDNNGDDIQAHTDIHSTDSKVCQDDSRMFNKS